MFRKMRDKYNKNKDRKFRENLSVNLFLVPGLLGLMVFYIIPFMIVVFYSMIDNPINRKFVLFKNYKNLFGNMAFQRAAWNTLIFSVTAVPLAVVFSLVLALLLDMGIPGKSRIRSFLLSPIMVPTASVVLIWQVLFANKGTVNEILMKMGGGSIDWLNSGYAKLVLVILFLWKNLGVNLILFMSALGSIPRNLIEVASLERASSFRIFFTIKLRYLLSTLIFVTIMSLINSFKIFREVYMLKGDYPYSGMYMLQHFMNNTFRTLDYQKMSAAAVIMTIVMIIIIGILVFSEDRLGKDIEDE